MWAKYNFYKPIYSAEKWKEGKIPTNLQSWEN